MADPSAPSPLEPILRADQFPVAGDDVWIKAVFHSIHPFGEGICRVRIRMARNFPWQIPVFGEDVFAQLRVGHVLKSYGQ